MSRPKLLRQIHSKDRGIMIVTPLKKDCSINLYTAIFCYRCTKRPEVGWLHESGYCTEDARNILVANVLDFHPEVTHLFFVDADTTPPKDTLERLLGWDKDIVSGVCPILVNGEKKWNVSLVEEPPQELIDYKKLPSGLFRAAALGPACTLIKREVFEKMDWPWFRTLRRREGIEVGNDFYFCNKVRFLGYEIWVDASIKCQHWTTQNLLEVFRS